MDAGGDGPEDEYEQYPCHWVELGLGAARIPVPKHWTAQSRDLAEATFAVAEIAGATFSIGLTCFEDPGTIHANALDSYLSHPAAPPLSDESVDSVRDGNGKPDYGQLTVHYGCTEGGRPGEPDVTAEIDIWRRINVVPPDHIRVAELRFRTPMDTDADFRRMLLASMRALVAEIDWAPEPTRFNRVAPTYGLKLSPLWDCIYLRVPETWQRERQHEGRTDMYVFGDPESDRRKLRIWFNFLEHDSGQDMDRFRAFVTEMHEGIVSRAGMKDAVLEMLGGGEDEALISFERESENGGAGRLYADRFKLAATERGFMSVNFEWSVAKQYLEDADMTALSALVEREIRNALVVAPAAAADDPPAPAGDGWKTIVLWDALRLNVPEDAEACFVDTDLGVLCKFDDPDREMWTLWVRMVRLPSPDPGKMPDRDARRKVTQEIVGETVDEMLTEWAGDEETIHTERLPESGASFLGGMKRTHDSIDVNDGERLLHTDWHRIAVIGDGLFDLLFEWVIVERVATEPAMQALSEQIAREVMQAGIVSA